ncbi:aldose 1-epimerase [Ameyamaea chiangmaiensis NBRC 103196]|uniref:Aldose 1-epimerase n=1 Tax=Ameyamaea chiangmaiensis TaxID=442969 RepID=A0A850P8P4_9PROT|nr:aldose 1-epimerase [Ameyamaea chiangmaiensis]MBS4073894.1 aldose 1-epimerase [Ameyamaea chiangmaiensis]NVN40354.1 aldose 1-epimerase [Ameyamaea chiangmaiensis]GBQ68027.1 aldose 1-epimerase [Ameyamaea chiangmaiensis NBRC 103196]
MIDLSMGLAHLRVDPSLGGAVLSWHVDGCAVLHPVSDANLRAQGMKPVGAYPLVPFSNRVGQGRFTFEGRDWQLDNNFGGEPHAIHGNGWERVWDVVARTDSDVTLQLDHSPPGDPAGQWPFAYRATLTYRLLPEALEVVMTIENRDRCDQPVGLGFHPFFPRDTGVRVGFRATSVWESGADNLPSRRLPVSGRWSFDPPRDVGSDAIDNCYAGWAGEAEIAWPASARRLVISADAPLRHLVLYTPPGRDYIACEAVSNMNDGFNHMDLADSGVRVLAPGERLAATITYRLLPS